MNNSSSRRVLSADMYVDHAARPGWVTGAERVPSPGEEVFCAAGPGLVTAVLGKTGDGSRLLEIRLPDLKAKPFFAAASNVLVSPAGVPRTEPAPRLDPEGSGAMPARAANWLG